MSFLHIALTTDSALLFYFARNGGYTCMASDFFCLHSIPNAGQGVYGSLRRFRRKHMCIYCNTRFTLGFLIVVFRLQTVEVEFLRKN